MEDALYAHYIPRAIILLNQSYQAQLEVKLNKQSKCKVVNKI